MNMLSGHMAAHSFVFDSLDELAGQTTTALVKRTTILLTKYLKNGDINLHKNRGVRILSQDYINHLALE